MTPLLLLLTSITTPNRGWQNPKWCRELWKASKAKAGAFSSETEKMVDGLVSTALSAGSTRKSGVAFYDNIKAVKCSLVLCAGYVLQLLIKQ